MIFKLKNQRATGTPFLRSDIGSCWLYWEQCNLDLQRLSLTCPGRVHPLCKEFRKVVNQCGGSLLLKTLCARFVRVFSEVVALTEKKCWLSSLTITQHFPFFKVFAQKVNILQKYTLCFGNWMRSYMLMSSDVHFGSGVMYPWADHMLIFYEFFSAFEKAVLLLIASGVW